MEYSRATAELVKEAGQVRVESGRMKEELESSQRELERLRGEARKKTEAEQSSVTSLNQELASRAQQVGHSSPPTSGSGSVWCVDRFLRWSSC